MHSLNVKSQNVRYAYALSTEGLLSNVHKVTVDTRNSVIDTIPISAARKIFALGAAAYYENKLHEFVVEKFTMTVVSPKEDTIRVEGNHYKLSGEMKSILQNISPDTRIYFEGIICSVPEEPGVNSIFTLLQFFAK